MIAGPLRAVQRLAPLFDALAPGVAMAAAQRRTRDGGAAGSVERVLVACGPAGAGHFVKMIHNGIEYE